MPSPLAMTSRTRVASAPILISIALVSLVFVIFGQAVRHGFINFDDPLYVTENLLVQRGITAEGIVYAFTGICDENWHPLTMLTHMVDCQIYGGWAGGHHLSSLLLHAMGSVLLFLLLRSLTGSLWKSALVAALWAVHPLRVESVAWVAELKDVLSGVFFLLTLMAYVGYVRFTQAPRSKESVAGAGLGVGGMGGIGRYFLVMLLLALGLMSKPMLVTLPFVLLLLDYWPLRRMGSPSKLFSLTFEKIPLLLISLVSVMATLWAQKGAIEAMNPMPLGLRLGNAVMAYGVYLLQMVWPVRLAVYYPVKGQGSPLWEIAIVLILLLGASLWVVMKGRRSPCLVVGWFWYLGMLVPVIGILKVGSQAYADRYTYLPMIGILIAVVWGADEVTRKWRVRKQPMILAGGAVLLIATLSALAWKQASFWVNSETLWRHTILSTEENELAYYQLALALLDEGRTQEAMPLLKEALRIAPNDTESRHTLATIYLRQGRLEEAVAEYRETLRYGEKKESRCNLATALFKMGRVEEAATELREVLRRHPDDAITHNNLGGVLLRLGDTSGAVAQFREGVRLDPKYKEARDNLAKALRQTGK